MSLSIDELKKKACDTIEALSSDLNAVSQGIWKNPELGFEEKHAHALLTDFLENQGFPVERNYVVETAFRSVIDHGEGSGPTAAVLCEYDALPGIGHACGHNLIAECGIGAAVGIKAAMDAAKEAGQKLGKLHVLGTPAEEGGGGKIFLIKDGVFKSVDFAMMCHPTPFTVIDSNRQIICSYICSIKYHGKASHAAAFPWEGINALDAAVMAYNNVSVLRQQIKPTWRIHGIITNGGAKPNIIPETAELSYMVRAPIRREALQLKEKVTACFEAAAKATGCTVEIDWKLETGYLNMISNKQLVEAFEKNSLALGVDTTEDVAQTSVFLGSTDMGNVSYEVPSIHPFFNIGTRAPIHTREFTQAAGDPKAQSHTLAQAKAMAMTAIDMFCQPAKTTEMKEQFSADMKIDMNDMPMSVAELKKAACDAIDAAAGELHTVSQELWNNPELSLEEHHAHKVLTDLLEKHGFPVERNFVLETGFRAVLDRGDSGPTAALLCEFDALPEIGHGCGHHLVAECGVGAALGVKAAVDAAKQTGQQLGKLQVLGTPAEEGDGGKLDFIRANVFKTVDFAMMCHPTPFTLADISQNVICIEECVVKYHGKASHAAAFPWEGVNALDAAVMAYTSISTMRQQLKPSWRVHGIISNGGVKPNIIPEESELFYYIRAPTKREVDELHAKIAVCFEAAATATGCTVDITWEWTRATLNMLYNKQLVEVFHQNASSLGVKFTEDVASTLSMVGSTDMGSVSYEVPSIHPYYSINTQAPNHTREFTAASGSPKAQPYTLAQAKAMAMTIIDFFCDPEKVEKMKEQFREEKANATK